MPSMRHTPSRGCYGRLVLRGNTSTSIDCVPDDEDTPLREVTSNHPHTHRRLRHHQRSVTLSYFRRRLNSATTAPTTVSGKPRAVLACWCTFYKAVIRGYRFCLTNIAVSIAMMLAGLGMSLGPGLHTLLVADPSLIIDKSIKAFEIPNHIVTKRQDAFTSALSELRWAYSHNRGRRETRFGKGDTGNATYVKNFYAANSWGYSRKVAGKHSVNRTNVHSPGLINVWNGSKVVVMTRQILEDKITKSVDSFYSEQAQLEQNEENNSNLRQDSNRKGDDNNGDGPEHSRGNHSYPDAFRTRRSLPPNGRIAGITQAYRRWKMTLIYLAQGNNKNMFEHSRLEAVHRIEKRIMNHSGFSDFCYINYIKQRQDSNLARYAGCAPLNSLMTYFYPSKTPDGTVHYDGLGSKLDKLDRTLSFAMTRDTFFWYVDDKINKTFRKSRLLRSEVQFGAPLPGYISFRDRNEEQSRKFRNFVITYIDMLGDASTDEVMVLYGGNELFDFEVDDTFWSDLQLSFFALGFIVVFMFVLTSFSIWLTVWGITSIILSFPLALFLYREVFGVLSLGILNGAAAFLIVGIGVDDVFVFINTFRQAHHMTDIGDRLMHTVFTAGKATFFTSFTTAAAFAANVASSIPAIHDFGLFMSLIVSSCWIMVVIMMPPVINLWVRYFASCESACYMRLFRCYTCLPTSRLEIPSDIARFLDIRRDSATADVADATRDDDDARDDVPLLQMEDVTNHEGGWPIYLGMLNQMLHDDSDDTLLQLEQDPSHPVCDSSGDRRGSLRNLLADSAASTPRDQPEGCSLTTVMQGVLFHFVATPVIKVRWGILGAYCVVLATSIGLMAQLHTATRPPQLFHAETNLQRIMDLAANFSDSAITCDECSGFFKENPVKPYRKHVTPPSASTQRALHETQRLTQSPDVVQWKAADSAAAVRTSPAPPLSPVHVPFITKPIRTAIDPESVDSTFDPCAGGRCKHQQERPNLELGAVVHVVFGIIGIDRSNVSMDHVLTEKGSVQYDENFAQHFQLQNLRYATAVQDLCRICKLIANNTKLVKPNGSQCIPQYGIRQTLRKIPECQNLPENKIVNGHRLPARAIASITSTGVQWIAFAFESTTYKGQSYFTAYNEYNAWEEYMQHLKDTVLPPGSPLINFYQTSDFWTNVMMEVVAVSSAIYGLVLSMIICITAVAIFTGHVALLLIVSFTIFGVICLVYAIFYLVGWEMGAVEAVSLSILVGSSVDYCVHLVEGYLLAGRNPPAHIANNPGELRRWRTLVAISHIGVSITSSALTTIVAAIPLTQTMIQPFSKFGQIVTINTSISILYTLTVGIALLSLFAPASHKNSVRSTLLALSGTVGVIGVFVLILFILSSCGVDIPAPNGENLFP